MVFPYHPTITLCQAQGNVDSSPPAFPLDRPLTSDHAELRRTTTQSHSTNDTTGNTNANANTTNHTVAASSHESCDTCLWTGCLTCAGLSVFFAHTAYEEWAEAAAAQLKNQKPVDIRKIPPPRNTYLWGGVAVGWVVAGIYRYQIG